MLRKIFPAGLLILVCVIVAFVFAMSRPAPRRSFPSPNGYDTVRQIADQIVIEPGYSPANDDDKSMRDYLSNNQTLFEKIDVAAQQDFLVAWEQSSLDQMYDDAGKVRQVIRLLDAKARVAEADDRLDEAIQCYLQACRIGAKAGRGGTMMHHMVANACFVTPLQELSRLTPTLDAKQKSEIRSNLPELQLPEIGDVLEQEYRYTRQANGMFFSLIGSTSQMTKDNVERTLAELKRGRKQAYQELVEQLDASP